ncbi:MAG: hypothetical protein U0169_14745 [Polyangiaceae bacterium]
MNRRTHERNVAAALAVATLGLGAGCGEARGGRSVEANLHAVDEEKTADKLLARGKAFANVGDLTRAEQYLALALEAGAPREATLPFLLRVCVEAKRYRVAIDYAEPELRRHPQNTRLRFLVASLYLVTGDVISARVNLEKVVDAAPDSADPHFALATILRDESGERMRADRHFREYLRLAPNGGHAEEARASLLEVVR